MAIAHSALAKFTRVITPLVIDIGELLLASSSIDVTECDLWLGKAAQRPAGMFEREEQLVLQNDS